MTVKMLKEILKNYDDNDRVIMDCGDISSPNFDNEFVEASKGNGLLLLQTRADISTEKTIESFLNTCFEEDWDEVDALTTLAEYGYKLSDFAYDPNRLEWAKQIAKTHGIWPDLIFTSPYNMANYVWRCYTEGDTELCGHYFDFDVKMRKSDIVKTYAWLQMKINGDDVYQMDSKGNRLVGFDISDEIYEGNCEKFLQELGETGFFARESTVSTDHQLDFIL